MVEIVLLVQVTYIPVRHAHLIAKKDTRCQQTLLATLEYSQLECVSQTRVYIFLPQLTGEWETAPLMEHWGLATLASLLAMMDTGCPLKIATQAMMSRVVRQELSPLLHVYGMSPLQLQLPLQLPLQLQLQLQLQLPLQLRFHVKPNCQIARLTQPVTRSYL